MSLKAIVGTFLLVVFTSSVVTRAVIDDGSEGEAAPLTRESPGNPLDAGQGFLPGGSDPKPSGSEPSAGAKEVDKLTEYLPMVTEASFFGLIGFALGYFSRKVVKVGLILLGVGFLAAQGLSYAGIVDIKWDRAIDLVNSAILDIKESQTWKEVFAHKIPTMGALVAGYFVGFRKG